MRKFNLLRSSKCFNGIFLIVFWVFIFSCFSLFLVGCDGEGDNDDDAGAETVHAVELVRAELGEFESTFQESGEVIPWRQAYLVPKIAGEVEAINCRTGDRVREGNVILKVDNTVHSIQLRQAKAGHAAMKSELEKLEALAEKGAIPRSEVRHLRVEFEQLEMTLELAQFGYDASYLRAPFDGVVSELMVDEGQLVGQEPIGRFVDTSVVKVRITATEDYISSFYKGMLVDVDVPAANFYQVGEVSAVGAAAVPETRSYMVEVKVNNPGGLLKSGMYATVRVSSEIREAVMIPSSALVEEGGKSFVFVPDEDAPDTGRQTASRRKIETGYRQEGNVEIVSGLEEGDFFVRRPPPGARDGFLYTVSGGADD